MIPTMAAALLCGCAENVQTNPARSVTEQLLLSTSADRAIHTVSLAVFAHKKVFVDGSYFDSYDSKYVIGAIRDALSQAGALLAPDIASSEIVLEARSGGLSDDQSSTLFGIPNTGIPIPLAGTVQISELALYKSARQDAIGKLALLAYETKSREHVFSSGPMLGTAYNHYYKALFLITWTRTDIPEKKRSK